jgi:UDP-N-acetylmuramoyl-L-alanyl-D-glutamate--2,6-diaminopimelate ligase
MRGFEEMKLHTLVSHLQPLVPFDGENPDILHIHNDNRKVTEGSLFICIKGFTVDGHDLAESAVQSGAVAIVAEKPLQLDVPVVIVKDTKRAMAIIADAFYGQPSQQMKMVGITGTNGKTTTSHIIDHILKESGKKTGLIGTMYTKIGDEVLETKNTTPESLTLQHIFHQMVEKEIDCAVMEVSSHALVEGRVHGTDYDVAVFTNLSQDHLDFHGSMEEYKRAKGLLFAQLGNKFTLNQPKYAVLNADDAASKQYAQSTSAHILTYGIQAEADIKAINIAMTAKGTSFQLVTPMGTSKVTMKLVGKFNVYNVLAGIGAAIALGISLPTITDALSKMEGVAGRFELVDAGQTFTVIVDYSHTPDSLQNALETIQEFAVGKTHVVVGCGGDRDRTKRPLMARIACDFADEAIFTSDNPRSEDPNAILKEMEAGVVGRKYMVIENRKEAIYKAINQAGEDDIILIAGKGHETYQQIGKDIHHFDDRLVAKEAILEKNKA